MAFKKKQSQTVLEMLQQQSESSISIIHKLISSLIETNSRIVAEKSANEQKISSILSEQEALDNLAANNKKIIANFEGLLGQAIKAD